MNKIKQIILNWITHDRRNRQMTMTERAFDALAILEKMRMFVNEQDPLMKCRTAIPPNLMRKYQINCYGEIWTALIKSTNEKPDDRL